MKTTLIQFSRPVLSGLLMILVPANIFAQAAVLDVQSTHVRPVIIAVPAPMLAESAPEPNWILRFTGRLRTALAFHGALKPLEREAELNDPSNFGSFRQDVWRAAGAEMLLSMKVAKSEGKTIADVYLFDVAAGESVIAKRYRSSSDQPMELADAIANEIVQTLLLLRPLFDQPLAFQYRKSNQKWRELYTGDWAGEQIRQRTNNQKLILHPNFVPGTDGLVAIGYRDRTPALRYFDLAKNTEQAVLQAATTMHGPVAMNDQQHVVFALEQNRNTDLYLLDLKSGKKDRLTTSTAADLSPAPSPDGTKIAFISDRRGNPYIYLLDMETRQVEPLVMEGIYLGEPEWSPDGKRLVFIRRDRGTGFAIWTYDFGNQQLTQITGDLGDSLESPTWAPDSRTILYSKLSDNSYDIWRVDRLLKRPVQLTRLKGDARMPTWRPY